MTLAFDAASAITLTAPGRYAIDVPDGWQQGKGAFGGLVLAYLVRAIEAHAQVPERRLRSLTAEVPAPTLTGAAEVQVEVLRQGSGVSTVAARLVQGGTTTAHAVAVLGKPRPRVLDSVELQAPAAADWREVPVLPVEPPLGPTFARHFEFRSHGPLPFSGDRGELTGFVRPHAPGAARDAAFVVACADVWWPVLLTRMPEPRPMGTVAFTLQLFVDPSTLSSEAPLFHRARQLCNDDGYAVEQRELWAPDGRLVALNQQTMALIA